MATVCEDVGVGKPGAAVCSMSGIKGAPSDVTFKMTFVGILGPKNYENNFPARFRVEFSDSKTNPKTTVKADAFGNVAKIEGQNGENHRYKMNLDDHLCKVPVGNAMVNGKLDDSIKTLRDMFVKAVGSDSAADPCKSDAHVGLPDGFLETYDVTTEEDKPLSGLTMFCDAHDEITPPEGQDGCVFLDKAGIYGTVKDAVDGVEFFAASNGMGEKEINGMFKVKSSENMSKFFDTDPCNIPVVVEKKEKKESKLPKDPSLGDMIDWMGFGESCKKHVATVAPSGAGKDDGDGGLTPLNIAFIVIAVLLIVYAVMCIIKGGNGCVIQ